VAYTPPFVDMVKQAQARVFVSIAAQKILFQDVHQRRNVEACGVLIGSMDERGNWSIEKAHPLRNIFDSPVYFEFAPEDLMTADLTYPGQIVGVYHSHPTGFAAASSTDRRNMQHVNVDQAIPWVWLIVRGPFHDTPSPPREGRIPRLSIVAYYHYIHKGLRQIIVEFEEDVETIEHSTL
jgi:[CysO sulfur-carrier protein]-S-L-cysteine hydrolase